MARTFLDEGTLALVFKEADKPADLEKISAAAAASALNISGQLVVGSTTFQFNDPETTDETSWADKGKAQTPTVDNYEGSATMFRDRDATAKLTENDPLNVFGHREIVYVVTRPGRPEDVEAASGQDYQYFKFMVSKRNPLPNPNGETEKIEIGFLPQGDAGFGEFVA